VCHLSIHFIALLSLEKGRSSDSPIQVVSPSLPLVEPGVSIIYNLTKNSTNAHLLRGLPIWINDTDLDWAHLQFIKFVSSF
jgi:hypothetical protein